MKDQIDPPPDGPSEVDTAQLMKAYQALDSAPERAASALTRLAESGSPMGMLYLGYVLRNGIGVPPDIQGAEIWYRRAADAGIPRARYHLGRLYLDNRQYAEALVEFERAASNGFAPALHFLGRIYYFGYGVPIDKDRGRTLLESAAKSGGIYAKALLAHDLIHEGGSTRARLKGVLMKFACYAASLRTLLTEGMSSDRLR
jgi:TPR repeat protein